MSWFKVDDKVHAHPKFKRIPRAQRLAASGLWMHAGAWSAQFETDGAVPGYILEDLCGTDELIAALVDVGLWDRADDGVMFHDWDEFQPTKAAKAEKRATDAERLRKWRQRQSRDQENVTTSGNRNAVSRSDETQLNDRPDPTRPDPTRPDPNYTPQPPAQTELLTEPPRKRGRAFVYPDAFEAFWAAYPRKDDKRKAHAAWERATREVDPGVLVAAAERYRDDPNRADAYTKLATSWLNAGAWENGPLPPRGPQGAGSNLSQSLSVVAQLRAEREAQQITHPQMPHLEARRTA